ncbi:MAG: ABC transporter permease, partial [bacterium]
MLRNYLKIALRNFFRQKTYAFINIFGLAVGIGCCALLALYIQNELSYDRFHELGDRIYRVITDYVWGPGMASRGPGTYGELALEIEKTFPEIQRAVRIRYRKSATMVKHSGEYTAIDEVLFTDAGFFEIFSFPLLRGNSAKILEKRGFDSTFVDLVLTASLARKLFGDGDPVGQVLEMEVGEKEETFAVTAIVADPPENAHFTFDMLAPFQTLYRTRIAINNNQFWTYLLLREGHQARDLENKLPAFAQTYHGKEYVEEHAFRYELQPLHRIYFGEEDAPNKGDLRYIAIFSGIALLILLIACANFMNLAVARSFQRTREVGVRKVLGARRSQLVRQFLGESILFCLLAIPLAIGIVELVLPAMSALAGKTLILDLGANVAFLLFLGGIVLFVAIVA